MADKHVANATDPSASGVLNLDWELIVIVGFTLIFVGILIVKKPQKVDISNGTGILLSIFGLDTSFKIAELLFTKADLGAFKEFKIYLVLGAFASFWMAIQTLLKIYRDV